MPNKIGKSNPVLEGVQIEDFNFIRKLGQGAYGKVYLASYNGQNYAVKKLSKDFLIRTQKINSVFRERDLLRNNKGCGFLPKMHHAFQDEENLYLVMEYIPNGSLSQMLIGARNKGFTKEVVQFYAAQMVITLEYL